MSEREPVMTQAELSAYLDEIFPQIRDVMRVTALGAMTATIERRVETRDLRPGGTVSGPAMFETADCAFYAAVLGMIGRQAHAVTSSMTINFMRRPPVAPIRADARILRLGRRLATGDVTLCSAGLTEPVAHAAVTYALPG